MDNDRVVAILADVGSILEFPDAACRRLYERAKDEQWHVDRDVDWDSLAIEKLGDPVRQAMLSIYSQIQFGELVALNASARIVAQAPHLSEKLFGATQLIDEARHVEFFSRVTAKLGRCPAVAPELRQLAREILDARSLDDLLLGTQIVLEGFAQTVFQEGARLTRGVAAKGIRLPGSDAAAALLQYVDQLVGRDESRHIAFGVITLREHWVERDQQQRDALKIRGNVWSLVMEESLARLAPELKRLGISAEALKARVRRALESHFRSIGFGAERRAT